MARVIFFGSLGDRVESAEQGFDLSGGEKTAREIFADFASRFPELERTATTTPIKVAQNQTLADWDTLISDGDELAFLPPVTGG